MKQRAFTLIEVIITCVIFTLILESVYITLLAGQRSWTKYSSGVLLKQNLRLALTAMAGELREAKDIFIVKDEHSVAVHFERPSAGTVSYSWADTGENPYQIVRRNYHNHRVLANDITCFSIDYPMDNQIIMNMAAGKEKIFTLKEKIALRLKTNFFTHK